MSLLQAMDQQWKETKQHLDDLRAEIRRAALQERAELAAATPNYADVDSLPTGHIGMVATVSADGTGNPALYWHAGTAGWQKVTA